MAEPKKDPAQKTVWMEVDVTYLKRRQLSSKSSGGTAFKPGLAPLFGLAVAVGWHYLHQAGEFYQPSPDDPAFWFHLIVEGTIAVYAAFFYLVIWKIWRKFK